MFADVDPTVQHGIGYTLVFFVGGLFQKLLEYGFAWLRERLKFADDADKRRFDAKVIALEAKDEEQEREIDALKKSHADCEQKHGETLVKLDDCEARHKTFESRVAALEAKG